MARGDPLKPEPVDTTEGGETEAADRLAEAPENAAPTTPAETAAAASAAAGSTSVLASGAWPSSSGFELAAEVEAGDSTSFTLAIGASFRSECGVIGVMSSSSTLGSSGSSVDGGASARLPLDSDAEALPAPPAVSPGSSSRPCVVSALEPDSTRAGACSTEAVGSTLGAGGVSALTVAAPPAAAAASAAKGFSASTAGGITSATALVAVA